jgi:hypothetical protein
MDTRFAFTLAQFLVGGYMFAACVPVAHAQAQQPLHTPGPAPEPSVPPIIPTAPEPSVPPPVPNAPGSSVTSPVNEPRSAARTHQRTAVAKPVHHRGRFIVAGQIPYDWRLYWDPRLSCCCCPIWNYPYAPDWLLRRVWPASP